MGELPAGWEWKRLGDVCNIQGGFAFKSEDYKEDGIPLLRISNISDDCVSFDNNAVYLDRKFESIFKEFVVKKGDIVVALSGATTGKYGKYHLNTNALLNQRVARIEIKQELGLNEKFLYFFISDLRDRIFQKACGVAQPNISTKEIENFKIPLPPLHVQRQIVAVLEQAEAVKRQRNEADALTGALLQSVFYEMFGDPVRNERGWDVVKIRDVTEKSQYGCSVLGMNEGQYPILGMNNLTYEGKIDLKNLKYVNLSEKEFENFRLECGDILFNRTNAPNLVGKTGLFQNSEDFIFASYLIRLKLKIGIVNPEFLWTFLNSPYMKNKFSGICKKAVNQANINAQELQNISIPLPPLTLQQQFARVVQEVERIQEQQVESKREIDVLFEGLMAGAFGGKLGLGQIE